MGDGEAGKPSAALHSACNSAESVQSMPSTVFPLVPVFQDIVSHVVGAR